MEWKFLGPRPSLNTSRYRLQVVSSSGDRPELFRAIRVISVFGGQSLHPFYRRNPWLKKRSLTLNPPPGSDTALAIQNKLCRASAPLADARHDRAEAPVVRKFKDNRSGCPTTSHFNAAQPLLYGLITTQRM